MRDISASPKIIEIRHKRRVRRLRIFILFLILIIIFIFALAFFSDTKKMKIDNVVIEGNHIIDKEEIESEIYKNISGRYFYLFSRSNSLIYPHEKIYDSILSNFPRIESLSVSRDNFKKLHIKITERVGTFLYCGKDIPLKEEEIGENCYFINNDGFIFDEAPYFSGNIYFKYYLKLKKEVDPSGQQMISVENFHKMTRFIDKITGLGFKPIYIEIDQNETNSLYLESKDNNLTPKIIFKNNVDFEVIYDNLNLAMQKKEFAEEINSKYNTLLYIDLRFKNKVLYKFSAQGGSASGGQ